MKNFITLSKLLLLVSAVFVSLTSFAQSISISNSGTAPDASAMLDVKSTDKGLLVPRMTAADRGYIATPATGLIVYQMDGASGFYYNGGTPQSPSWVLLIAGPIKGSDIASGIQTTTNTTLALGNNNNNPAELRLLEPNSAGNNYTSFQAQPQSADINYILPNAAPSENKVLKVESVDGNSAILNWGTAATGTSIMTRTDVQVGSGNVTIDATGKSFIRITSAGGPYNLVAFSGGVDGQTLTLVNISNQPMTIVNEDGNTQLQNRIHTEYNSNMVKLGGESVNNFIYDGGQNRWRLL